MRPLPCTMAMVALTAAAVTARAQSDSHRPLAMAPADTGAPPVAGGGELPPPGKGEYIQGAPAELSAEEAAKQLANPNSPLASLTLKSQWRTWDGDLPGAGGHGSGTFLFQPTFPFRVDKTDTVFFRPALSYLVDQPVVDSSGQVKSRSGFADLGFDLAYGRTTESGLLAALGMVGSIPIGGSGLSSGTWGLGPEVFVGVFRSWGVLGVLPNHVWDVGGGREISVTTIQPFAVFLPGGAWSVGTAGLLNYDWVAEQWTVPLQLQVSKTVKIGNTPWKFALEGNYYVERSPRLGPEWMFGFNITPVVPNIFDDWIHGR